jgi:ATP-dependent Clp protease ATP-binding subunit ClpA
MKVTKRARNALRRAHCLAAHAGRPGLETSDVFLALMEDATYVATSALAEQGIKLPHLRHRAMEYFTSAGGPVRTTMGTEREPGRDVFVSAFAEAHARHHEYLGTEHLLLGLLNPGGRTSEFLHEAGISPEQVRKSLVKLLAWPDE